MPELVERRRLDGRSWLATSAWSSAGSATAGSIRSSVTERDSSRLPESSPSPSRVTPTATTRPRVVSPAYQQLQFQEDGRAVQALLVGQSGPHHFSAVFAVEERDVSTAGRPRSTVDVADRCRGPVEALASTYTVDARRTTWSRPTPSRRGLGLRAGSPDLRRGPRPPQVVARRGRSTGHPDPGPRRPRTRARRPIASSIHGTGSRTSAVDRLARSPTIRRLELLTRSTSWTS